MKTASSLAHSLQRKQHSQTAPKDLPREPLQKTDSKGAKGETKVTPLLETSGRSSLEIHRQQTFTAPQECAEHKYSKGKKED